MAEHIANSLTQPLHVHQASDLMGKYVGETEQNMAPMFCDAERENAVLLLNEADNYLLEVNEMLHGVERFHGIFI